MLSHEDFAAIIGTGTKILQASQDRLCRMIGNRFNCRVNSDIQPSFMSMLSHLKARDRRYVPDLNKAWAGFDYATIVAVAEKIPTRVLEEDPQLLMWYAWATTRMGDIEERPL